ncbi:MAG: ACP S-malonyltransferase [Bdellovibrionales bacterium]|nr:ACP S-malonyltransferase [Bdellovibrionales bacterium]
MFGALFPGQGSQHVGMADFLLEGFPRAKHVFEEASDAIGVDLVKMVTEGDEATLALTENTQPALVTMSFAVFRVLKDMCDGNLDITAGAGHSVGEYSALACSGAITLTDAVKLVRLRGQLMQQAVPVGTGGMMAVIGMPADDVLKLCAWTVEKSGLGPVEPANYNSPAQTVISGSAEALKWLKEKFEQYKSGENTNKIKLIPLKVSAPFHCSLMRPAEAKMKEAIESTTFHAPQWGIIQNYTASLEKDPDVLRVNLVKQISGAVRWTECMQTLKAQDVRSVAEFGPGRVLTGLLKKIDPEAFSPFNLNSVGELNSFENHIEARIESEKRKKMMEEAMDED